MKLKFTYFFLFTLSLLAVSVLVLDLFGFLNRNHSAIAEINTYNGTVKILPAGFWSWDYARIGSGLSIKDTVSTGALGDAEIQFKSGLTLKLLANSMVVIDEEKEQLSLNFISGDALITAVPKQDLTSKEKSIPIKKIEIKRNGVTRQIASVDSKITQNSLTQNTPVKEVKVEAKKEIDSYSITELEPEKIENVLNLNGKDIVEVKTLNPPELVYPPVGYTELLGKDIVLSWKEFTEGTDSQNTKYILELVEKSTKRKTVYNESSKLKSLSRLPPGEYLWRVSSESNGIKSEPSLVRSFKVLEPPVEKPQVAQKEIEPQEKLKSDFRVLPVTQKKK